MLRGRSDLWAAGVVYALGSANFLFDKSTQPYISASDLCAAFGTNLSSTTQKATLIRDMFDLGYMGNREFLIKELGEHRADLDAMLLQMVPLLMDTEPFLEDEEGEPTPATRRGGEFVDGDHPVSMRFYNLAERYERTGASPDIQSGLEQLIERDPDYYDSYLVLAEILDEQGKEAEAEGLRETAYQRALTRVLDKKGQWPKSLEWGWLENRHVIRTFLDKAQAFWNAGDQEGALTLMQEV